VSGRVVEMLFVRLTGGFVEGEVIDCLKGDEAAIAAAAEQALAGLRNLVAVFDDGSMPYRSRPWQSEAPRYSDYTQLARVSEWSVASE